MWSPDMLPTRRRAVLAALAGTGGLTGCGFHLRQPPQMVFQSIALTGFAPRSPMAEALSRGLAQSVRLLDSPARAEVVLQALVDSRDRNVVATTAAAQVRELQLRVRLNFRAHTPSGRELLPVSELVLTRDLTYAESVALAKEYEEADLFRDMQADIVAQVLRRLAAIKL